MSKKGIIIATGSLLLLMAVSVVGYQQHTKQGQPTEQKQSKTQARQDLPQGVKHTDWDLVLVNDQHRHPAEFNFQQAQVAGKTVDQRIVSALNDFRAGAQAAGYPTTLVSGYRSVAYQKEVFASVKANNKAAGLSDQDAEKKTAAVVASPGASEHMTGLAVDLAGNDAYERYPGLEAAMDQFPSQQWLIQHAADYGFILRFPKGKQAKASTMIDYESWHFRYVGRANAQYMVKHHLTLEEYIQELKKANR
ncbi:M15 family metallopeptidase [Leuconostocaceae bacterium ESL0958]|nr:M15 family metallopeptidase [Leuconostocaceae bacterium ESL0958]